LDRLEFHQSATSSITTNTTKSRPANDFTLVILFAVFVIY